MRPRSLIAGAAVAAGLMAAAAPGPAVATTTTTPPGCTAWLGENRGTAHGACDSSVTTPWRLTAVLTCSAGGSYRVSTEYSLTSPKELGWGHCIWREPEIQLQP